MSTVLLLSVLAGLLPFAVGYVRLPRNRSVESLPQIASLMLCALAFNLVFFVQELGLVIPKALVPGLQPVLYHNDHDWVGDAPIAELLQASGACATMLVGLVALTAVRHRVGAGPRRRLLLFWLAFQGLFQSLSQIVVGTAVPGNDVGRALAYLNAGSVAKAGLAVLAMTGLALAGIYLARSAPPGLNHDGRYGSRSFARCMALTGSATVALTCAFRAPRSLVEVLLVPLLVMSIGAGWLVVGMALTGAGPDRDTRSLDWRAPTAAVVLLLTAFHLILRPGLYL